MTKTVVNIKVEAERLSRDAAARWLAKNSPKKRKRRKHRRS